MSVEGLPPPPMVESAQRALEIARIWIVDNEQQVVLSEAQWSDAGAWGLMLADLARHVARIYARGGVPEADTLSRIRQAFDAEWDTPTA